MLLPALALGANPSFPGSDPAESPRANTPDDPEFDRCENDDPDTSPPRCTTYFDEEFRLFGFSPDTANAIQDPAGTIPHYVKGTRYANCDQLDADGKAANRRAEGVADGSPQGTLAECLIPSGIRLDQALKYSTGSPDVSVAILDTGIRWERAELRRKVRLNRDELPLPLHDRPIPLEGAVACAGLANAYDADGNGRLNVLDYACDSRVSLAGGDQEADSVLDASDLIAAFSNSTDGDSNGYIDDIAGWDFFDDDNDPFDASSCCSATNHGSGRAEEAVAETNNAINGVGICPDCQFMPLRVWDTFVVPIDNFAMGTLYAAENGAAVVEGAVGGLGNSRFARRVFEHADSKGVALMLVSSDINSANHNYPTNYNEAVYVAGAMPDTAPNETCSGPGGLPGIGNPLPDEFDPFFEGYAQGCQAFLGFLANGGVFPNTQPITTTFFRNSNLTQYGGKADIVLTGSTGSQNTGQASGAAALLAAFGREKFGDGDPLSGNEIRQLMTMTAEDVLPENTGTIGQPDKASEGWDPHFGYGRLNLPAAMKRIAQDRIPPEAQIDGPDWFAPINLARVGPSGVPVRARIAAPHGAVGAWELEYACGQDSVDNPDPLASDFADNPPLATGTGPADGVIGAIPKATLQELADSCNGEVVNDAGRPAGGAGDGWPADPYPNPDPERHAFQIRLTVHAAGDAANIGRYRKTLFAYNDDGNLPGWPRAVGTGSNQGNYTTASGGEVSPRLYDVDADNKLDVILPTTSGELSVLDAGGVPVSSFNNGQPVATDRYQLELNHPVPAGVPTPREALRNPAIGDIDGDREAEIVATAGEHLYSWDLDGSRTPGFPVGVDRSLSEPCKPGAPDPCFNAADRAITGSNHIKRGFIGSPALADLDCDGRLDAVAGSLDQHVYAWDGTGASLPGFPVKLQSDDADGAEIITTPAIAELDGEGCGDGAGAGPEVIIASNEVIGALQGQFPDNPGFTTAFSLLSILLENGVGANPVYALDGQGEAVDGWPVTVGVAAGDLLPLVLPGHDSAVLDQTGDGDDEVSVSAATSVQPGGTRLVEGNGQNAGPTYEAGVANSPDQGPVLNLADYQSVGDITGSGSPAVIKGGLTVNGAANLLAVNQNLPFSHVEQAWDALTGAALPGYPVATDDFQLLSQASIARVGGGVPGAQALVGTGLYQLHAYGNGGVEPPGWPKFTGGWLFSTPAVGDADGDGDLDVTTVTREGWSFLWGTDQPACGGANDEWWTFHHDEHSSNNYGTDGRPPGSPRGLGATRAGGNVTVKWTAPGDDWLCGTPARYQVIGSADPIKHPGDGAVLRSGDGAASGQSQSATFTTAEMSGIKHVAVLYRDEAGNWGLLRSAAVPGGGGGNGGNGGNGGGLPGRCANTVNGTSGADTLRGSRAGDRIFGFKGADDIRGYAGEDCLYGQRGRDVMRGGKGDDFIKSSAERDVVYGGPGRDVIRAGVRNDRVFARDGFADRIACGHGRRDVAFVDFKDKVFGCEIVKRRRPKGN